MKKRKIGYLWKDAFFGTIFSFIILLILYFIVINLNFLDPFKNAFNDFSYTDIYYSRIFKPKKNGTIIIVNVKKKNRLEIANAINIVASQNPSAIGLDVIFKEKKNPKYDSILKQTLKNHKNIITSYSLNKNGVKKGNHEYFITENDRQAYIDLDYKKNDGVTRDFVGIKNDTSYSFATKIAVVSKKMDLIKNKEKLKKRLPINFIGNIYGKKDDKNSFLVFDIDEVLDKSSISMMDNAIVLFGYLGDSIGNVNDIEDKMFSPLNKKFTGKSIPDMYGVVFHANIINMLTNNGFIRVLPNFFTYLLAFIISFFSILYAMKAYKKNQFVYGISLKIFQLLISIVIVFIAFFLSNWNLHINITPIIVFTLLGLEMIDYYVHLLNFLKKHLKWKSQLLD